MRAGFRRAAAMSQLFRHSGEDTPPRSSAAYDFLVNLSPANLPHFAGTAKQVRADYPERRMQCAARARPSLAEPGRRGPQVHDHPARAGLEAIMDQKLFHQRIKSERSSAYWFAASLWGVTGLIMGAILGVYMTSGGSDRLVPTSGATTSSPAPPPMPRKTASTAAPRCCRATCRQNSRSSLKAARPSEP